MGYLEDPQDMGESPATTVKKSTSFKSYMAYLVDDFEFRNLCPRISSKSQSIKKLHRITTKVPAVATQTKTN